MERLKAEGEQAGQCLFVCAWRLLNAGFDRLLKRSTIRLVLRVQTLLFDKRPEPFNQIHGWRIGRSVEPLKPSRLSYRLDPYAPLIASVVQDDRDREVRVCTSQ